MIQICINKNNKNNPCIFEILKLKKSSGFIFNHTMTTQQNDVFNETRYFGRPPCGHYIRTNIIQSNNYN